MDFKKIPIIILSRDRLICLKQQIEAFTSRGYHNIVILDVQSTYPPLLEYYSTLPYKRIRIDHNAGHGALVTTGVVRQFNHDYYAYTDCDVIPVEECPNDFMERHYNILQKYPQCTKVGFGLKIDDIPDHYHKKEEMIGWEKQFWNIQLEPGVFAAPIDTTYALCRPGRSDIWAHSGRTGEPYIARHSTWYLDPNNLPEDELYYAQHINPGSTNWSGALAPTLVTSVPKPIKPISSTT